MNPLTLKKISFAKILSSTGLLVLVLLWILPTVGLLVSSFQMMLRFSKLIMKRWLRHTLKI